MLQTWNPWQELDDLQRRLNRPVRSEAGVSWVPATDIVEDEGGLSLYLDLPDVDEGSLEVSSEQNSLTVKATRRSRSGEGQTVHFQGRPKGAFTRVFTVPSSFDLGSVAASYDQGVLTLRIARAESARPRKIDVATGSTRQGHQVADVNAEPQQNQRVAEAA